MKRAYRRYVDSMHLKKVTFRNVTTIVLSHLASVFIKIPWMVELLSTTNMYKDTVDGGIAEYHKAPLEWREHCLRRLR